MITIRVSESEANERLDVVLTRHLPQLSRSFITSLIKKEKLRVNDSTVKAGYKLRGAEIVHIDYDLEILQRVPPIKLPVLYEDTDCLVINKPSGVLTHSKGAINPEATVATFILPKLQMLDGERAGIVHRLDRATSGIIICAKHPEALSQLQKQFSQRKAYKLYHAVVSGHLKQSQAIIDMPIERNPKQPKTFRTSHAGKPATTKYKVLQQLVAHDLVELNPQTGRTHQLRVHLQQLGHPIVGDTMYNGQPAERLFLHASRLEITIPSGARKAFEAPLPTEFNQFMESNDAAA